MARRRFISNGIWTNPKFVACSIPARLLFIGLVSHADDEGRLGGHAVEIGLQVFPGDRMKPDRLNGLLQELADGSLIFRYVVEGRSFIEIPKFGQHQDSRYRRKSEIPPFQQVGGFRRIRQQVEDHVEVYDHVDVEEKHSPPPKTGGSALDSDFAEWWELYPLKDGRKPALEQYRSAKKRGATGNSVLEALRFEIDSRAALEATGKFVPAWPHAKTWLRQDRWRDSLEQKRREAEESARTSQRRERDQEIQERNIREAKAIDVEALLREKAANPMRSMTVPELIALRWRDEEQRRQRALAAQGGARVDSQAG